MSSLRDTRRRIKQVAPQFLSACVMLYFLYHAVQGDRGFLAWLRLTQDLEQGKLAAVEIGAQRERLEERVGRLQPEHLDPDLLDERARALLNLGRPDEVVIVRPK
jgi:cell division protein FtsB